MKHDLEIRRIPFDFDDNIPPIWNRTTPERSQKVNGASLALPYLEPFLIKNIRKALPLINDSDLPEDTRAFVGLLPGNR